MLDWSERMRGHRSASVKSCPLLHLRSGSDEDVHPAVAEIGRGGLGLDVEFVHEIHRRGHEELP